MFSRKLDSLAWFAIVAVTLSLVGCGPPRAAPQNQQLIASLRTAISAQNSQWLAKNAELLEERRAAGEMSDEEYEAFQAIVDKAKAGQWEDAEQDVIAFQKAQRPTDEQVNQVTQRAQHAH